MVDSIGSTTKIGSPQSIQAATQANSLRNNPAVLNAIVQTQQKSSGATAPVKIFAVPQSAKSGNSSTTRLPRGSLVDVLA
jgi:hypothetical protein